MKWFQYDSPLFTFLSRVADLMILNLLFLVFCIPVVTIGASATAMYTVLFRMADDSCSGTIAAFWNAFRANFKKSTLIFLILLLPVLLVVYEQWLYFAGVVEHGILNAVVFSVPLLIVTFLVSYAFPLTAKFENTVGATLKNALLISIAHLPVSVLIALLNLLPFILLFWMTDLFVRMSLLFLVIGFSGIAFLDVLMLRRIFRRYIPAENAEDTPELPSDKP